MKYVYSSLLLFYFVVSCDLFSMHTSSSLPDLETKNEVVVLSPLVKSKSLKNLNTESGNFLPENLEEFNFDKYNNIEERAKHLTPEEALHIFAAHQKLINTLNSETEDLDFEQNNQSSKNTDLPNKDGNFNVSLYFLALGITNKNTPENVEKNPFTQKLSPAYVKRTVGHDVEITSPKNLKSSVEKIGRNGESGKKNENEINGNGGEV